MPACYDMETGELLHEYEEEEEDRWAQCRACMSSCMVGQIYIGCASKMIVFHPCHALHGIVLRARIRLQEVVEEPQAWVADDDADDGPEDAHKWEEVGSWKTLATWVSHEMCKCIVACAVTNMMRAECMTHACEPLPNMLSTWRASIVI